ncbi:PilW family protein [Colwelliaceae bacterium 6471]
MMMQKQQGFSLIEVFIALAVGLALLTGVLSVFVGMRTTTSETSSYGEMQENGRFAISVLTDDLFRQDYWGDLTKPMDIAVLRTNPAIPAVAPDCNGEGINNGSFPGAVGKFRTLWGDTVTTANMMGCITDAKIGSDVIQIKRVISSAEDLANPLPDPVPAVGDSNRYYLITDDNSGNIFRGNTTPANIRNSQVWQYQHHVYYIREEAQGSNVVPVLRQGRLTADNGMQFDVLVDGIEMIRFMYGVDTDADGDTIDYFGGEGDGIVDAYISADNMTADLWDNRNSRILAVKMYVLVRDIMPDNKYENTNTYTLGDIDVNFIDGDGNGDNYRRLLFTSTVTLHNTRTDKWP